MTCLTLLSCELMLLGGLDFCVNGFKVCITVVLVSCLQNPCKSTAQIHGFAHQTHRVAPWPSGYGHSVNFHPCFLCALCSRTWEMSLASFSHLSHDSVPLIEFKCRAWPQDQCHSLVSQHAPGLLFFSPCYLSCMTVLTST